MDSEMYMIKELPVKDESTEGYEIKEKLPVIGTDLNTPGEIVIEIDDSKKFLHPHKSCLLFEGQLLKEDGITPYITPGTGANQNVITLTNNGLLYLFSCITYKISDKVVEYLQHPGQATTMLGLLKYSDGFSKSQGLNQLWTKDNAVMASANVNDGNIGYIIRHKHIITSPRPVGTFAFVIPLDHVFGFCEDYNKVIYGTRYSLSFIRQTDEDAIFRANNTNAGMVKLTKLAWLMPRVDPAYAERSVMLKTINENTSLPMAFRVIHCYKINGPQSTDFTWQFGCRSTRDILRFVNIGFQTNKSGNQEANPAIFYHLNLKKNYLKTEDRLYPEIPIEGDFEKEQFARFFYEASTFMEKFFKLDKLVSTPNTNPSDYKTLFPLFVFDVCKQGRNIKTSTAQMEVTVIFAVNPPVETKAYIVTISDREFKISAMGDMMTLMYWINL